MGIRARLRWHDRCGKGRGFSRLGLSGGVLCLAGLAASAPEAQAQYSPFAGTPGAFTIAPGAYGAPPGTIAIPAPVTPAPAPAAPPPVPPSWLLTPAFTLGETFTDNVNLSAPGSTVWDFITTLTPELDLAGQTARATAGLTYDPQELIFARSSPSSALQQRLLGTGTFALWPETLFFDASASINQAFARATGPIGPSTLTTSNNLTTVYATNASPYLRQHLGSYSDAETRYRFTTASTDASGIAPEEIHELRQTFFSGEAFGRLGWQLTGDYTRLNRLSDTSDPLSGISSKDALARANLTYPVYQALSATGSVGYEHISDPTLTTPVSKGILWNAGLQYQPNQLVAVTLTYGERFNTNDIEFNGTYNLDPQLRLSALYTETIETSLSQLAASTNQIALDPATGLPVAPGTPGAVLLTSTTNGISSGSFLARTATLSATLTKARDTYTLNAYESKESGNAAAAAGTTLASRTAAVTFLASAAAVTAERIFGTNFSWDHKMWPDLIATAGAGYFRTVFPNTGRVDNEYTLSLALSYTISPTATANISLLRSDLRSNIPVDSLAVDTVMATIRKQF